MVYQGTVWGPSLWNLFFEDARHAITTKGYEEVVYADDLNAFKAHDRSTPNDTLLTETATTQKELHTWGAANKVTFDSAKESSHVLCRDDPAGGDFKILGVTFDCRLSMKTCVHDLANKCAWKIRTLMCGHRYYPAVQMVDLYKAHVLSYIEYRTPAIYHSTKTVLEPLDKLQTNFLLE